MKLTIPFKQALVTGASGFVGRVLCQSLLEQGISLCAVGRNLESIEKYQLYKVDLSNQEIPEAAFSGTQVIFHLAGVAHSGRNAPVSDDAYWRVNVQATEVLLKQAVENKVSHFVYFSSVKAIEPNDIYGKTKRAAEECVLEYGRKYGLQVCILRPALVYGPSLKGNLKDMQQAIIKGWFPPVPETHNQRSMVSVQDLVRAAFQVVESPLANQKRYTVTDGKGYSTRQIYEILCALSEVKPHAWAVPAWLFRIATTVLNRRDWYEKLLGSAYYQDDALSRDTAWQPTLSFFDYQQWSKSEKITV